MFRVDVVSKVLHPVECMPRGFEPFDKRVSQRLKHGVQCTFGDIMFFFRTRDVFLLMLDGPCNDRRVVAMAAF